MWISKTKSGRFIGRAEIDELAAELWGLTEVELQEIREGLEELR